MSQLILSHSKVIYDIIIYLQTYNLVHVATNT